MVFVNQILFLHPIQFLQLNVWVIPIVNYGNFVNSENAMIDVWEKTVEQMLYYVIEIYVILISEFVQLIMQNQSFVGTQDQLKKLAQLSNTSDNQIHYSVELIVLDKDSISQENVKCAKVKRFYTILTLLVIKLHLFVWVLKNV